MTSAVEIQVEFARTRSGFQKIRLRASRFLKIQLSELGLLERAKGAAGSSTSVLSPSRGSTVEVANGGV